MFFFDARIFTLVVEYCGCVKRRPDYGSGNIDSEGCRRVIWLLVSSWQRGPVCRQHQGRDGSIVVANDGCRRVIWLLVSSWQRGPVCIQHQGRDGSIVVASEVRFS